MIKKSGFQKMSHTKSIKLKTDIPKIQHILRIFDHFRTKDLAPKVKK